MTDHPKPPASETPMQRALRMKKAAQQAKAPSVDKVRRGPGSGIAAGASKPWMKR